MGWGVLGGGEWRKSFIVGFVGGGVGGRSNLTYGA